MSLPVWAIVVNNYNFHYSLYIIVSMNCHLPTFYQKCLNASLHNTGMSKMLPLNLVMFRWVVSWSSHHKENLLCTWKVLKGTCMEVQVIGAQSSYKFVTSPIHKRKARAVSLCMKLHVGMAQVKSTKPTNFALHEGSIYYFIYHRCDFLCFQPW
jgi:hypothetical protein